MLFARKSYDFTVSLLSSPQTVTHFANVFRQTVQSGCILQWSLLNRIRKEKLLHSHPFNTGSKNLTTTKASISDLCAPSPTPGPSQGWTIKITWSKPNGFLFLCWLLSIRLVPPCRSSIVRAPLAPIALCNWSTSPSTEVAAASTDYRQSAIIASFVAGRQPPPAPLPRYRKRKGTKRNFFPGLLGNRLRLHFESRHPHLER